MMRAHFSLRKWVLAAIGGSLLWAGADAPAREWSDASGKFHTEADFVARAVNVFGFEGGRGHADEFGGALDVVFR